MDVPIGTKALIFSKLYYGVLSKSLEKMDIERYYSILYFLSANDGCTQQHICNNLAIDKTAMVKVIDYLMEAKLIERKQNPEDRREHFVVLTKKGAKETLDVVNAFKAIDKALFDKISTSEKEIFLNTLKKLCAELKELPANDLFFNYIKTSKK